MLRIGIIGLGTGIKPHALSLRELADEGRVEVCAGYSRTAARRDAFRAAYGFPVTDDLEAILNDPAIDAVFVVTPANTHLEITRLVAAAGKHVLLEKPLEVSTDKAEQVVRVCREAGVKLAIMVQNRFKIAALTLRDLIDGGEIGRVVKAGAYIPLWRPQAGYYDQPGRGTFAQDGGGVLITQGIHTLDLLLSYMPPVAEVTAFAGTTPVHAIEVEDVCGAALRFADGAIGVVDATTACYPGLPERVELVGELATAFIDGAHLRVCFKDGRELVAGTEEEVAGGADPMAFSHSFHRRRIEDFLDAIENDRRPRASGEDVLRAHRLIDALLLSSRERRPVALA